MCTEERNTHIAHSHRLTHIQMVFIACQINSLEILMIKVQILSPILYLLTKAQQEKVF